MIFIMGISPSHKKLDFHQTVVCKQCGRYGRLEVMRENMHFSLFFIPLIKWNKKYFVVSTCCNTVYTIDSSLGKSIERGEVASLSEEDLQVVKTGGFAHGIKTCSNCGYESEQDFIYCPKCGNRL